MNADTDMILKQLMLINKNIERLVEAITGVKNTTAEKSGIMNIERVTDESEYLRRTKITQTFVDEDGTVETEIYRP